MPREEPAGGCGNNARRPEQRYEARSLPAHWHAAGCHPFDQQLRPKRVTRR